MADEPFNRSQFVKRLYPMIVAGQLDHAWDEVARQLSAMSGSPYDQILQLKFSNSRGEVGAAISGFASECQRRFDLKAIYLEMNGFFINPDRWYFECFGYDQYVDDTREREWLCRWQLASRDEVTLTGLEALQEVYEEDWSTSDPVRRPLQDVCDWGVLLRFQQLIHESMKMVPLSVPVLCTAHEMDTIYRILATE